jgi:hypothetical protein
MTAPREPVLHTIKSIEWASGISTHNKGTSFITVDVFLDNGDRATAQFDITDARKLAMDLLACIEAGVGDTAVYWLLIDKIGLEQGAAVSMVQDLRNFREDMRDEPEPERLAEIAHVEQRLKVNGILAQTLLERGIVQWWGARLRYLDDRTPNDVWNENPDLVEQAAQSFVSGDYL